MSSRERKRAARRKRKERGSDRGAAGMAAPEQDAGGPDGDDAADLTDIAAEAEARGISRSEIRNERAREALEPLAEGERPLIITIGAALSALVATITVVAWVLGAEVGGERPNAIQVLAPAILFGIMAWGMWRLRYWAVLGFQAVMAILMVGAFLTLISATSAAAALTAVAVLVIAGTLFWFTVKALARIQMPDRHLPR